MVRKIYIHGVQSTFQDLLEVQKNLRPWTEDCDEYDILIVDEVEPDGTIHFEILEFKNEMKGVRPPEKEEQWSNGWRNTGVE